MDPVFALSLQGQLEKIGSYAGFAAIPGVAILSLLYISQAREVKRLREWAGRAPERAQELQERVSEQAAVQAQAAARAATPAARRVTAQPIGTPREGAAPAGVGAPSVAAPATPAAAGAATATEAPPGAPGAPAKQPPGEKQEGSTEDAKVPVPGGDGDERKSEAEPSAPGQPAADKPAERPGDGEPAGPVPPPSPAPATAAAAAATPPAQPAARSQPAPQPAPRAPASPLRASSPAATLPPQRGTTRLREQAGARVRGPARTPLIVAGVAVLVIAILLAVTQIGGGGGSKHANRTAPPSTSAGTGRPAAGTPINRGATTVAVLNGTTVPGLAAQVSDQLERGGFKRGSVTNAADQQRSSTSVAFAPGYRRAAQEVARLLKLRKTQPLDANTQAIAGPEAAVVVTVGTDRTQ